MVVLTLSDEKPVAEYSAGHAQLELWPERIELRPKPWAFSTLNTDCEPGTRPLAGVHAAVEDNFTAKTLFGKPRHPETWLTMSGPGFGWPSGSHSVTHRRQ